jgi:hypothetical protein
LDSCKPVIVSGEKTLRAILQQSDRACPPPAQVGAPQQPLNSGVQQMKIFESIHTILLLALVIGVPVAVSPPSRPSTFFGKSEFNPGFVCYRLRRRIVFSKCNSRTYRRSTLCAIKSSSRLRKPLMVCQGLRLQRLRDCWAWTWGGAVSQR